MRRYRAAFAFAISLSTAGCTATFDIVAPASDERAYASLYPYYAEFCAVSQIKKKPGFGADTSGGPGGHSVFYLNGVCRDRAAGYPTIALCGGGTAAASQGVGLSVNAHFKNANWVVTDGHDFFFEGDLSPGERLTKSAYDRTQDEAKKRGIYDGVVFYGQVFDDMPKGEDRRDYMYEVSVATDYAIGFGRDRYCARVPLDRAQMSQVVDYLNGVNAIYKDGKTDFVWNVVQNNCAHLAHNALASAGIWDEWETDRFIVFAAFDFPVPKNEFVNLMRRTNDMDLADLGALYGDASIRHEVMDYDRIPAEPGSLAEASRVVLDNDIYDTDLNLIFYDDPVFGPYRRRFNAIFAQPRYTDIRANLHYFSSLYRQALADRRPLAQELPRVAAADRPGFAAFYQRYYDHIDRQLAAVDRQMAALGGPGAAARSR